MAELHRRVGFRRPLVAAVRDAIYRFPNFFYLGMLALVTAALVFGMWRLLAAPWWAAALIALPASQAALALVNPLVNRFIPPRRLPRMDFSEGIPPDCRTFVVVPTLLLSRTGVERLLENLEIHLPGPTATPTCCSPCSRIFPTPGRARVRTMPCWNTAPRVSAASTSATAPPTRRSISSTARRQWNASEDAWMGWERKRGKLTRLQPLPAGRGRCFRQDRGRYGSHRAASAT